MLYTPMEWQFETQDTRNVFSYIIFFSDVRFSRVLARPSQTWILTIGFDVWM